LLTPSVENLRNRAERLAPQFVQAEDVVAAEAVECEAELGFEIPSCVENGFTNFAGRRSYCIALTPKNGDVIALSTRLQNAITPVVGRPSGKRLLLDLRTVFPRDDQRLVQILVGQERQLAEELAAEELSLPIGNA
jgi:seryl-tRNA(Sec) selenium transferase